MSDKKKADANNLIDDLLKNNKLIEKNGNLKCNKQHWTSEAWEQFKIMINDTEIRINGYVSNVKKKLHDHGLSLLFILAAYECAGFKYVPKQFYLICRNGFKS